MVTQRGSRFRLMLHMGLFGVAGLTPLLLQVLASGWTIWLLPSVGLIVLLLYAAYRSKVGSEAAVSYVSNRAAGPRPSNWAPLGWALVAGAALAAMFGIMIWQLPAS